MRECWVVLAVAGGESGSPAKFLCRDGKAPRALLGSGSPLETAEKLREECCEGAWGPLSPCPAVEEGALLLLPFGCVLPRSFVKPKGDCRWETVEDIADESLLRGAARYL